MEAIAAVSLNNVIGNSQAKGILPWKCSEDFKHFKRTTMGRDIIVGRNTFNDLPRLDGRRIFLLSNSKNIIGAKNIPYWITNDTNDLPENALVCGGAKIYAELLPYVSTLYLTIIKQEVEGDVFFPPYKHLFSSYSVMEEGGLYEIRKYLK